MGENTDEIDCENIETLLGKELPWCKVGHPEGFRGKGKSNLVTYRLTGKRNFPSLKGKTHFYWSSGGQFLKALKEFPEIRDAYHSCGPGHTYDQIAKEVTSNHLRVILNHQTWLQKTLSKEKHGTSTETQIQ